MRQSPARSVALALVAVLVLARGAAAQMDEHTGHHHEGEVEGLGAVHFPVSCAAGVQPAFDRAVAYLHSFGYEESRAGFQDVAARDPSCAMARWGEAMTYFHPLWAPPIPDELVAGAKAAAAAAALPAKSPREVAYVAAIGAFYKDAPQVDHRTRAAAYRDAMRGVHERFPDDTEATIFYALSMLGAAPPSDPTLAQQKEAAALLNGLLASQPHHPGIIHYLIHAFDYPATASLALDAARVYASIAPLSPHARHMPSHIFTRLGLWQESIASNWSSVEAAQAEIARTHPGATAYEALHAYDYLEYAYLQLGQDDKAREVMETVAKAKSVNQGTFSAAYGLAAVPARYALERRQWKEAADLQPPAIDIDWSHALYAAAILPFANAVGAARLGDAARARPAVLQIAALEAKLAAAPPAGPYDWAGQVKSMRLAAEGWVARAEKRDDEAVRLLEQAADLEDKGGKHPVTPGAVLPAREQLGDLLLELGRPDGALAAYDATLAAAPNRWNALAGAARAAAVASKPERVAELQAKLKALCGDGCERMKAADAAQPSAAKSGANQSSSD